MTQSGRFSSGQVLCAGFLIFGLAFLFGVPLIMTGGLFIAILLLVSIALGYLYTGGPFPLAYVGLGDLFALAFFGVVGTMSTYYLQTGELSSQSLLAGLQIGFLATVLIAINNLRDHVSDAKAHKRTCAVRFGVLVSKCEISFLVVAPFLLGAFWLYWKSVLPAALPLVAFPVAAKILRNIWKTEPGAQYNQILCQSALLHFLFGSLLSIGLYVA